MRGSAWRRVVWCVFLALLASKAHGDPPPGTFYPVANCQLYDSWQDSGPVVPDEQREILAAGTCGVPRDAAAVYATVQAATSGWGPGAVWVFPEPDAPNEDLAVPFEPGEGGSLTAAVSLRGDALGTFSIKNVSSVSPADVVISVSGYYLDPASEAAVAAAALPAALCKTGTSVQSIDCWEKTVTLNNASNSPALSGFEAYSKVRIRVDFKLLVGTVYQYQSSTYAFWNGNNAFTFRNAFASEGGWTWTAVCENLPNITTSSCGTGRTISSTSGAVTVGTRRATPLLYQRGPLAVDPSGRFLRHDTGTKFFWLGDTAWTAPMRIHYLGTSTAEGKWNTYLDDRRKKPSGAPTGDTTAGSFTVVQVALAAGVGNSTYTGSCDATCVKQAKGKVFVTTGNANLVPGTTSYWVPDYWRRLDKLVYQANEKGLVVVLAGVMDPFGTPSQLGDTESLKLFARNLAARMAGFFVIYTVGWDDRAEDATYSCGSDTNIASIVNGFTPRATVVTTMKAVGAALDAAAPGKLITTHLGGGTPFFGADNYYHDPGAAGTSTPQASAYSLFHREGWLDFHLFQSSQCNPDRPSTYQHGGTCGAITQEPQLNCVMRRARMMPAKFLSLKADDTQIGSSPLVKPAANGEARYEAVVASGQPPVADIAYQSRHAAHVTTLSGAFGFTTGVDNVTLWKWPGDNIGITGAQAGRSPAQLKQLGILEEGQVMEWERLRRKELMLRNAGTNENERSVVAASESNRYIVGYLPERSNSNDRNLQLAINTSVYVGFDSVGSNACRWSKMWWNPLDGTTQTASSIEKSSCGAGQPSTCSLFKFNTPACAAANRPNDGRCDWVLLLRDLGSCPSGNNSAVKVWSEMDTTTGDWSIIAQEIDDDGTPMAAAKALSDGLPGVQTSPQVAIGGSESLVVWVGEDAVEKGYGVLARQISDDGSPLGDVLHVSEATVGDQLSPSVASTGNGGYVVVWTSYSEYDQAGEVYARFISDKGQLVDRPFVVNTTTAGAQGYPQVAADADGNAVVAWESWGQDGDGNGIFARRLDLSGPVSDEFQVNPSGVGWQYLAGVTAMSGGLFEVDWQLYNARGQDLGTWGQLVNTSGAFRNGSELSVAPPEGGLSE